MILRVVLEGLVLGALLILLCAIGIRKSPVNMVYLYPLQVQERCVKLGLTTHNKIKRGRAIFKAICIPGYIIYTLVCVYAINDVRGFLAGFWQIAAFLFITNLIDRFLVDEYWVGHTKAWVIPGTEDLQPYIRFRDKVIKWLFGTVGVAVLAAILSGIATVFTR